jgi:hypothetical protein
MNKLIITLSLLLAFPAFALDILCTGQGNQGELIEIELDLNARANTVSIEGETYQLTVNSDYVYVWQNELEDLVFTNVLSRINGNLNVLVDNGSDDEQPVIRAILSCKDRSNLLF